MRILEKIRYICLACFSIKKQGLKHNCKKRKENICTLPSTSVSTYGGKQIRKTRPTVLQNSVKQSLHPPVSVSTCTRGQ